MYVYVYVYMYLYDSINIVNIYNSECKNDS